MHGRLPLVRVQLFGGLKRAESVCMATLSSFFREDVSPTRYKAHAMHTHTHTRCKVSTTSASLVNCVPHQFSVFLLQQTSVFVLQGADIPTVQLFPPRCSELQD